MDHNVEKLVLLGRHAQCVSNKTGIHEGAKSLLTEEGEREAQLLVARILAFEPDTLIASTFPRAIHTIEPAAQVLGIEIIQSDLFVERRRPSESHGQHYDVSRPVSDAMLDGYCIPGHRHSDEENFDDLKARAIEAFYFLEALRGKRIYASLHGMFKKFMIGVALFGKELTGPMMRSLILHSEVPNTGVCQLEYGWALMPSAKEAILRWKLILGDTYHLSAGKI